MRAFWFDVETTGLDAKVNDITQLAFQLAIGGKTVEKGHILMRPLNPEAIDPKALDIQGKTEDEVMAYPEAKEGYEELTAVLDKHIDKFKKGDKVCPGGYNVWFDYQFVAGLSKKLGEKYGLGSYLNHQLLDPLFLINNLIAFGYIPTPENRKLATVCGLFGIELADAHDPMADLRATRKLYSVLVSKMAYDGVTFIDQSRKAQQ